MIGISTGGNKLDNKILDCYCKDDADFSQIAKIVEIDENHHENIIYEKSINFPRNFTNEGVTGAYILPTHIYRSGDYPKCRIAVFFKILQNIPTEVYVLDWNGTKTVRCYFNNNCLYANNTRLVAIKLDTWYTLQHGYDSWRFRQAEQKGNKYIPDYVSFQPPIFTWRPIIVGDANDNVVISSICIENTMTTIESKGAEFGSWHAFTSNNVYYDGRLIKGFVDKQANIHDRFVFNYDCILDNGLTNEVEKIGTDYNRTRTKTGKFLEFRRDWDSDGEKIGDYYFCDLIHRIAATQSTDNQIHYKGENGVWNIKKNKFSLIKRALTYNGGVTCIANKGNGISFYDYNSHIIFTNCNVLLKFSITPEIITEDGYWTLSGEFGNYNMQKNETLEFTYVLENLSNTNSMPVPIIYNGSDLDRHFIAKVEYYII